MKRDDLDLLRAELDEIETRADLIARLIPDKAVRLLALDIVAGVQKCEDALGHVQRSIAKESDARDLRGEVRS